MNVKISIVLCTFAAGQSKRFQAPRFTKVTSTALFEPSSATLGTQWHERRNRNPCIKKSFFQTFARRGCEAIAKKTFAEATSSSVPEVMSKSKFLSIRLPLKQSLYTVLRSPHIDKKSREQFELKVHKQLIIINTETKQLRDKLSRLKFHELSGVQMKVIFHYKTRLNSFI